jgi:1-deoxy-D-xylulose-5-phosphate synthase
MATQGMVVFATSTHFYKGYDQVIHDVAIQNLPVIFCLEQDLVGEDGGTHHGVFDLAYLVLIPWRLYLLKRNRTRIYFTPLNLA